MRIVPFLYFCLLACALHAQTMDTAAVRQEVDSLITLNQELVSEGKYGQALQLIQEAEEKCLAAFGEESALYAYCLNQHGILYFYQGMFSEAIPICLQSKAIRAKVLGEEHPLYAKSLNLLAILYTSLGRYEKAEGYFLKASAIWGRTLGKIHPDYARSRNNVAILYRRMGNYEKAEPLYLESKAIREKTLGREHPDYAQTLNNLAIFYEEMGAYKKAEPIYLEAAAVYEKVSGKEHPDLAMSLKNLADLYQKMGDYEKAETIYLETIAIRKKTLGKNHHFYASSLSGLAVLYRKMKRYEEAESLFLEAKAIVQQTMGENNVDYTQDLLSLGSLYFDMERYREAEALYQEAIAIDEEILGNAHPKYASDLSALADLYVRTGQFEKAEQLLTALFNNLKTRLQAAFSFLSENEKEKFIRTQIEPPIAQIQSAALNIHSTSFQSVQYDVALLMKGIRLQAGKNTLEYILQQKEPDALEYFRQLLGVRRRLARQYERPVEERAQLDQLKAREENLEKSLARLSATYRQQSATAKLGFQEVKADLKAGEAAIEFVHFNFYDHQTATDSALYAALVLRPETGHAVLVPLFAAQQLDALLSGSGGRRLDYVAQLYTFSDRGVRRANEGEVIPSLYELIWQPIDSLLEGVQTIYYSPTGLLHRLNLGAIPLDEETILADKYRLFTLTSTRRLAIQQAEESSSNPLALLFGGLRFDYDSLSIAEALIPLDAVLSEQREMLAFNSLDRSLRGESWKYLKWTVREAEAVQELLDQNGFTTQFQTEYTGTEELFKYFHSQATSPKVLHLATHGFFFPDPDSDETLSGQVSKFKQSEHPMIRSGLILSGANQGWLMTSPNTDREDGVLTAFEISQLNLTNTELVVLSACETGLGDIQGSEGVFGLQRAFKMAGARYLIMSLWQVPDFQTQDLMVTFYSRWLEGKMTIPEAFKVAQQEMKEKYQNPYFWAGFVLME